MTNDTKKLVNSMLENIQALKEVYFKHASIRALYPHSVFDFESIDLGNYPRKDQLLLIDIWTKNQPNKADDIADEVEHIFNAANMPNDKILPTFYLTDRKNINDVDETIERVQIKVLIQNYERGNNGN